MNTRRQAEELRALSSVRWAAALLLGLVWWWAVLRVALQPARSGPVEQGLAAGGWTLSVLPVHAAPRQRRSPAAAKTGRSGAGAPVLALPVPRRPRPMPRRAAVGAPRRPLGATAIRALSRPSGAGTGSSGPGAADGPAR